MTSKQNGNGASVNNRLSHYDPEMFPREQRTVVRKKHADQSASHDLTSRISNLITKSPAVTLIVAAGFGIALGIWVKRR